MNVEDVQAVIGVADDVHPMAQIALRLAAATDARRGELAARKWSDFSQGTLTIDSAISVDPSTAELIEAHRDERSQLSPWIFGEDVGHTDPSTTLRVDAHAVRARDQELAGVLGEVLDSGDPSGS